MKKITKPIKKKEPEVGAVGMSFTDTFCNICGGKLKYNRNEETGEILIYSTGECTHYPTL